MHRYGHLIAIFGNQVTIATSGKMATNYRHVLCQITGIILAQDFCEKKKISFGKKKISEKFSNLMEFFSLA